MEVSSGTPFPPDWGIFQICHALSFFLCCPIGLQHFRLGLGFFGLVLGWFAGIHDFTFTGPPVSWDAEEAPMDAPDASLPGLIGVRCPHRLRRKLSILILFVYLISLAGFWVLGCLPCVLTFRVRISAPASVTDLSHFSTRVTSESPGQKTFLSLPLQLCSRLLHFTFRPVLVPVPPVPGLQPWSIPSPRTLQTACSGRILLPPS